MSPNNVSLATGMQQQNQHVYEIDDDDDGDGSDDSSSVEVFRVVPGTSRNPPQTGSNVATALKINDDSDDDSSVQVIGSKPPPQKKRKRGQPFRCNICLEDELEPYKGYTLPCNHRFCISCLGDMVKAASKTVSGSTSKIVCPAEKCSHTLCHADIQHILRNDRTSWNDYTKKASLAMIENQAAKEGGDMRRCPADRCNYIFVFVEGDSRRHFDCPSCHSSFCLKCDANDGRVGPAHPGMSCYDRHEQLKKQAEEKRKFELWKKENSQADARFQELLQKERSEGLTRPCPACKRMITKNGGCDHMYCVACKTHFSWSSGRARRR